MAYTLTESEAYDVAHILRQYAERIRADIRSYNHHEVAPNIIRALEQAAESREQLAKRIEDNA